VGPGEQRYVHGDGGVEVCGCVCGVLDPDAQEYLWARGVVRPGEDRIAQRRREQRWPSTGARRDGGSRRQCRTARVWLFSPGRYTRWTALDLAFQNLVLLHYSNACLSATENGNGNGGRTLRSVRLEHRIRLDIEFRYLGFAGGGYNEQ
jgi:hypothetical protein